MNLKLISILFGLFILPSIFAGNVYSDEWSFLGVSDTGDGNGLQVALEWASVHLQNPSPKFIIHGGDSNPIPRTEEVIKTYFGKPFYPVMGNHDKDVDREYAYKSFYVGKKLPNLVDTTLIEKEGDEAIAYSFVYDNVYFIALDQYFNDPFRSSGNIYDEQLDWVENQLTNNPYPFIFVIGHEPAYPLESQRNYGDSMDRFPEDRDRFWATLAKYDVSAFLCGHTHSYLVQNIDNVWHVDMGQCWGTNYYNSITYFTVYNDHIQVHAYYPDGAWHDQFVIHPRVDPHPVELSSLSYKVIHERVKLLWQTTTEENNYGFEIQKTTDNNKNYNRIGFVPGHGTTQQVQNYEFFDRVPNTGNVHYRLKQIDFGGDFHFSQAIEVSLAKASNFQLIQNYPNPFNQETIINYEIHEPAHMTLRIYNACGQLIHTLVDVYQHAGFHQATWDGTAHQGQGVPSGLYFYRLATDGKQVTKKMVMTR